MRVALEVRGFDVRTEVGFGHAGVHGRLDLAAYGGDQRMVVAVEIDRSNKPGSLAKLRAAAAMGVLPLWIRWGHDLPSETGAAIPPEIVVVEVPTDFRRGRAPRPLSAVLPACSSD